MPLNIIERLGMLKTLGRPTIWDYIPLLFTDFTELHGDRYFGDDPAMVGGIGLFNGEPVTVVSQVRAKDIQGLTKINFSMPHPEGYRKVLRLIQQAEKFRRPVICFIDTPGAFCGVGAEERGQGEAIARSLYDFMMLKTPVLSLVLGEGGSGGALAIGVCDELAMLENALYSVISPKGCASILWKDGSREKEAAELLRITSEDLRSFGICDHIVAEPDGGAANNVEFTASGISAWISSALARLAAENYDSLPEKRYQKFRKMGIVRE
ncbi:MAG: acetyl-CoA carboxylase carboxyl transferase subunit alpha [Treponema sp.]|nr:acetyl-CoA carboxylase carboxyl transferase subunit alpha [Treponema sp.]